MAQAKSGSVETFRVGDITVWAIADIAGTRDMNPFPEADAETLRKYVPTGFAPNAVMAFAVQTAGAFMLVDAGYGNLAPGRPSHLMNGLAAAGLDPRAVELVLLTHMHLDHLGGLFWEGEKAFPNAKVLSSRDEQAFWLDPANRAKHPDIDPSWFEVSNQYLNGYGSAVDAFNYGDTIAPGIRAVDNRGHTPGQTGFQIESKGQRLFIWGDLVHAAALQFPRPDINSIYDMNPAQARETRLRHMQKMFDEKMPLAGVHLPFPAVGTIKKTADGGFAFATGTPAQDLFERISQ